MKAIQMLFSIEAKAFISLIGIMCLVLFCLLFCGCAETKKVTGADGKPFEFQPICVNTPNGRLCYTPGANDPATATEAATTPEMKTLEK